ncbi:Crp/Fnr family transcriptional regulator [Goodfellowiella coeruleoviolacea]|uniref:cAMP-binding domain of CRP or a regulatory subunit of cAMP-dependent protein kinases n=1 Tax=Goodfellowiella coeruleoviolacea TaxID=334858 RepID=A0AAE3GPJ4_9PSEU|nr:Crp/Fnr family transcriptional regulator [Goodfellowiella coeruleoviolacea]MCP2169813.1 cAMP-binding domain of CRP or a regulatory subunit of cAMP-dependent protein kinases [Goodfellowiella coeruleoviolacea]
MNAPDRNSLPHRGSWPADSLLAQLRPATRTALLGIGTQTTHRAKHLLMHQADPAESAVLLLSGVVKVWTNTSLLDFRGGGDLVGELGVINHKPRSASVVACTAITVRQIPAAELTAFLTAWPDAMSCLLAVTCERFRRANERRVDLATLRAPARVGQVLLEITERYGWLDGEAWQLGVPLTQAEIASAAGVSLATVEKTMNRFRRDGVLRCAHGNTLLVDLDRLRAPVHTN